MNQTIESPIERVSPTGPREMPVALALPAGSVIAASSTRMGSRASHIRLEPATAATDSDRVGGSAPCDPPARGGDPLTRRQRAARPSRRWPGYRPVVATRRRIRNAEACASLSAEPTEATLTESHRTVLHPVSN